MMAGKVPEKPFTLSLSQWGGLRFFRTSALKCLAQNQDNKSASEVAKTQPPSPNTKGKSFGGLGLRGIPTYLDKLFLVGSGVYKSMADIPKMVDEPTIHRARSWGRIRINIGFLFIAAIGGGVMVYLGKSDAARGLSLERQNLDWHRKINEEHKKGNSTKVD